MPTEKVPELWYWDIRGRAQAVRLILAYTETKYENKYEGEF